jgi:uncharacterized protein
LAATLGQVVEFSDDRRGRHSQGAAKVHIIGRMAATIVAIYRYPVKGLSAEAMDQVSLVPGECLPQDRRFAIALGTTAFDPDHPAWLSKTRFVMLMRDESLARLSTRFDADSGLLSIAHGDRVLLAEPIGEPEGGRRVAAFLEDFLGGTVDGPLRVVAAPGHAFADARRKPNATTDKYVSLINLASIRALEAAIGAAVDPLRFRANVYFDGLSAWRELDWLGGEIRVGGTRLRAIAATTRCAATEVNPQTAERDLAIVGTLERRFGHNLMGVYAEVEVGGDIAVGDVLTVKSPTGLTDLRS